MHRITLLFLLCFIYTNSFSQFSKSETAPPGIRWQYKKSENFKVFFPKELDSIANYTISFLENNINPFLSHILQFSCDNINYHCK